MILYVLTVVVAMVLAVANLPPSYETHVLVYGLQAMGFGCGVILLFKVLRPGFALMAFLARLVR